MNTHKSGDKRMRGKIPGLTINLLVSIFCFFAVGELALRIIPDKYTQLDVIIDERNTVYSYDEKLGWFPIKNRQTQFMGSRTINVKHNNIGFRDNDFTNNDKPGIIFLGDSFVWGYDVQQHERFTDKIQQVLNGWDIINMGVSGYGTDQEHLLLKEYFHVFKPDIVFLLIGGNDHYDVIANKRHLGYYKPYFELEDGLLKLKGVPVPKSVYYYFADYPTIFSYSYTMRGLAKICSRLFLPQEKFVPNPIFYILHEMKTFVESNGATLYVGLIDDKHYDELLQFLNTQGIDNVDLRNDYRYVSHGRHWTPFGHSVVSGKIMDFLYEKAMGGPG
jgi:hypothetical protein